MFIGIEDLVPNAFIELVERTGRRTISFSQLNKYGEVIVFKLKAEGVDAALLFNRDITAEFFDDYSDLFRILGTDTDCFISLSDNISTSYLNYQDS